jgi:hypothetical protein
MDVKNFLSSDFTVGLLYIQTRTVESGTHPLGHLHNSLGQSRGSVVVQIVYRLNVASGNYEHMAWIQLTLIHKRNRVFILIDSAGF